MQTAAFGLLAALCFEPLHATAGTAVSLVDATAGSLAEVGVIDGRVRVENAQGGLSLSAGEAAIARPGQPPQRIEINPRDQVRWAIYYPPAMWELPAGGAPIEP